MHLLTKHFPELESSMALTGRRIDEAKRGRMLMVSGISLDRMLGTRKCSRRKNKKQKRLESIEICVQNHSDARHTSENPIRRKQFEAGGRQPETITGFE